MKHLKILLIVTVIGMTLMGVGYATWTDEVVISGRVTIAEVGEPEIIDLDFDISIRPDGNENQPKRLVSVTVFYEMSDDSKIEARKIEEFPLGQNDWSKWFEVGPYQIRFHNFQGEITWEIEKLAE